MYDVAKKYMKGEYEQIDLIGKKTQRTATTVEVSESGAELCGAEGMWPVAWVRWVLQWLSEVESGVWNDFSLDWHVSF